MQLSQLLGYSHIVIQCHDNPDPDALGSAYALYRYFEAAGARAEIIYGGFAPIAKANLLLMENALRIPLTYIGKDPLPFPWAQDEHTLLLIVDGQYGAGNVKQLPAKNIAVIDHHVKETDDLPLMDIRPFLSSCATLVWQLLRETGFDLNAQLDIGTALYYGLYTDSNSLSEIAHPLDMDARDSLRYDSGLLKKLKNTNLTIADLTVAGRTLTKHWLDAKTKSAVFEAEPCDPNILGFTSDLALQVDDIDACVVFCQVSGGVKISVRSCVREIMANELAARLTEGVGSGGGHKEKAGGFISREALERLGEPDAMDFLKKRFAAYYGSYDLVYSERLDLDLSALKRYRKLQTPIGFAKSTDVFPAGTELVIRTLEGDSQISAHPDIYIIVGVKQEVYPIRREKFARSYRELAGEYHPDARFLPEERYQPTVKDRLQGLPVSLLPFTHPCVPTGEVAIFAKELQKRTKVFTAWNLDGYMFGDVGDFLAVRDDDEHDAYVIEKEIFRHTYEPLD